MIQTIIIWIKSGLRIIHLKFRYVRLFLIVGITIFILNIPQYITLAIESENSVIQSGIYNKGYRYNIQGWIYIHIEGEPYERGYQYGYLASAEIVDMIYRWSNFAHNEKFMKRFKIKQLPENYDELSKTYWKLCKRRGMRFFWDQYPEEYQNEIKGIADGVRARDGRFHGRLIDYKDIFTLNVIEETRETFNNPGGVGHPLRLVFNSIKREIKAKFNIGSGIDKDEDLSYCTAFLATGDATTDGRLIASHSLIFANYMSQRTNMILDVQPSEGHRFVMTVFPGYIWSSQDFHESECGIVLMETVIWPPFGPWRVKRTIPVGARVRKAIQYSESIDDVIQTLLKGNNGLYPSDWLIGDAKTGEIASIELGLFNHAITRTKNGFLWSCSNVKDDKVRWEQWSIFRFGILGRILRNKFTPSARDEKFEELGNKYYGRIDVDTVKEIMAAEEICKDTTDCKITDSELIKNLGLWVHQGRPDGFHWKPNSEDKEKFKGVKEHPSTGWLKTYASKSQPRELFNKKISDKNPRKESNLLWEYKTAQSNNIDYATLINSKEVLFVTTSSGSIFALNSVNGRLLWEQKISEKYITSSASKDLIFTGCEVGLHAKNKENGKNKWEKELGKISSKPIIAKDVVIAGFSDGNIYAFDIDSGEIKWNYKFPAPVLISELHNDIVYACSEDTCYAVSITDKETKWEFETNGIITASPSFKDNVVYFGSWDGNVYAVESNTGKVKWVFETGWGIDITPAVADGMIFVGSMDNNFYAIDKENGKLKWVFNCLSAIHSSPVAYGEFVFFGSDDGRFYALNKQNGVLEWCFSPGFYIKEDDVNNFLTTPILSNPIVSEGVVYIEVKGSIYALDAQTYEQPDIFKKNQNDNFSIILILSFIAIIGISLIIFPFLREKKQ
jgi:outer membrane protein assembly factor BamB